MKPVTNKADNYPSKSGGTPISAASIVWEGPDIPCIKLCKGDTIDKVVYDLAKILCDITENLLDVTQLDFNCLVEDGACEPKTIIETLQALIDKACQENIAQAGESYEEPILPLPECLHYLNAENDTVTQLVLSEYTTYLASKICEILLSIDSINSAITNLNNRINEIDVIISNLSGTGSMPTINIVTQCLSSDTPGEIIPIDVAFSNLETALCDYIGVIGTIDQWQTSIANICIDDSTPLACGEGTYGDLPNWISNPTTAAGSVNNLWVAFCSLNTCITNMNAGPLCEPTPVENLRISVSSTTSATIAWDEPVLPASYEEPISYTVNIYETAYGVDLVDSYTVNHPTTQKQVAGTLTAGKIYFIEVIANYDSCGASDATQTSGILIQDAIFFEITYASSSLAPSIVSCGTTPVDYSQVETEVEAVLTNINTGAPAVNNSGLDIEVTFTVERETCAGTALEDLIVTIANGASSGTATFISQQPVDCNPPDPCIVKFANVTCVQSYLYSNGNPVSNTQLDPDTMPPLC